MLSHSCFRLIPSLSCCARSQQKTRHGAGRTCLMGVTSFHATPFCTWLKPRKRGMLSTPLWHSKSRCSRLNSTLGGRGWASESPLQATHQVSSSG